MRDARFVVRDHHRVVQGTIDLCKRVAVGQNKRFLSLHDDSGLHIERRGSSRKPQF